MGLTINRLYTKVHENIMYLCVVLYYAQRLAVDCGLDYRNPNHAPLRYDGFVILLY